MRVSYRNNTYGTQIYLPGLTSSEAFEGIGPGFSPTIPAVRHAPRGPSRTATQQTAHLADKPSILTLSGQREVAIRLHWSLPKVAGRKLASHAGIGCCAVS